MSISVSSLVCGPYICSEIGFAPAVNDVRFQLATILAPQSDLEVVSEESYAVSLSSVTRVESGFTKEAFAS